MLYDMTLYNVIHFQKYNSAKMGGANFAFQAPPQAQFYAYTYQ